MTTTCSRKAEQILHVLTAARGRWVSGSDFLSGRHTVPDGDGGWKRLRCSSYSQRCGDLIRAGHRIERDRRGDDGLGRYRLVQGD